MKTIKSILSMAIVMIAFNVNATVRTVNNTPTTTIAQYNNIQAAVNASVSGDTVYVHGSPNTYSAFSWSNKQLVIIGPGMNPDKNMPFPATVQNIYFIGAASSGSEIQGLIISGNIEIHSGTIPSNIRITRNYFSSHLYIHSGSPYSGFVIEGNYFVNTQIIGTPASIYTNFVIQNNIFYSNGSQSMYGFNNPLNSVLVDHNLWYGPSSGSVDCFSTVSYAVITNNIFVRRNAINNTSYLNFANNITFNAGNNTPWIGNSNTDNGGNLANQDPQMVAQSTVNAGSSCPLCDFTIAAGPANNAGIDGKDLGLLYDTTGSLNWANSRNSRLPRIYQMNITNPTIPSGGTLLINVEGRKSN